MPKREMIKKLFSNFYRLWITVFLKSGMTSLIVKTKKLLSSLLSCLDSNFSYRKERLSVKN